jgi:hypothetical protein
MHMDMLDVIRCICHCVRTCVFDISETFAVLSNNCLHIGLLDVYLMIILRYLSNEMNFVSDTN